VIAGYTLFVRILTLLVAVICVPAGLASARGGAESGAVRQGHVLLVYPLGGEPEQMVRERLDLPDSASTLFWSDFKVVNGKLSIGRAGSYSLPRLISRQEGGRWAIYEYQVSMNAVEAGRRKIEVSFSAEEAQAQQLQPAPYAVREAIGRSGSATGTARLASIEREGSDGFRAVVELK
jgi:hypothetical protein